MLPGFIDKKCQGRKIYRDRKSICVTSSGRRDWKRDKKGTAEMTMRRFFWRDEDVKKL